MLSPPQVNCESWKISLKALTYKGPQAKDIPDFEWPPAFALSEVRTTGASQCEKSPYQGNVGGRDNYYVDERHRKH